MMTFSDDFTIKSMDDLMSLIDEVGFVPFFANGIEGFSIEEHIASGCWYDDAEDSFWPAWEWKGPVIKKMKCGYGKFLQGKAMYISGKWFPDFANFRRDGYDFDARFDDELASHYDKELYDLLDGRAPVSSKDLKRNGGYGKSGKKGFDTMITRLQKQCYVITSDFIYSVDKTGNKYGWGIAEYTTPEKFMGSKFKNRVYKYSPEESYYRVLKQFKKILPGTDDEMIKKILK